MSNDHNHLLDVGVEAEIDLIEFVGIRIWDKLDLLLILKHNGFCFCMCCSKIEHNAR